MICFFDADCKDHAAADSDTQTHQDNTCPDYDDVGALTMLHAFADKGEAKIYRQRC